MTVCFQYSNIDESVEDTNKNKNKINEQYSALKK